MKFDKVDKNKFVQFFEIRCATKEQLNILQVIVMQPCCTADEFQRPWQWFDVADVRRSTDTSDPGHFGPKTLWTQDTLAPVPNCL